jgi:hypothetical protein
MADLRIDIASEFTGKAAFTKATKATDSLDKAVGKLGKQLASVFALSKIVAYGKASVKAFTEDERAVSQLTTAVKNLGLAFAQPEINNYISRLESSAAIADDELRPAFQALLTTTGSLTKSQELLGLAIEGSRGSGIALTTVAQDLANAYNGNTRGLRKYNLGLTKAELTTVSFTEVQQRFNKQFSGANQAFLETYAGKLGVLTVAAGIAQETIGKGLVDALVLAGGKDGDVQDVADAMANLSNYTADSIRGVGILAGKLTDLDKKSTGGILSKLFAKNFELGWIGQLNKLGAEVDRPRANRRFMGGAQANLYSSSEAAEKRRARELKKLQDAQLKATKALTAEQKKQAALKKAGSIFDLEQIQIIAALQGNLSKEERTRLEAQFALLNGNAAVATALTKQILMSQDATGNLYKLFQTIPDARNPFAYLEEYLNGLARKAAAVLSGGATGTAPVTPTNVTPTFTGTPFGQAGSSQEAAAIRQLGTPFGQAGGNGSGFVGTPFGQAPIVVQIDGKAVATALQDSSLSGISSSVNRTYGSFAGR